MKNLMLLALLAVAPIHGFAAPTSNDTEAPTAWYAQGEHWLKDRLQLARVNQQSKASSKPRNIILFVGDGMSITTLTAARIFSGQKLGEQGEEYFLHFERFPHSALIKTYNTDQQTPDSAGTMTAMMTGVKTRAGVISLGPEQPRGQCKGSENHQQETLLEWGAKQSFDTGIVTTARITHATPAATYAHSADRGWEGPSDRSIGARLVGCPSIGEQLMHNAFENGLDLAMGGGKRRVEDFLQDWSQMYPKGVLMTEDTGLWQGAWSEKQHPVLGLFADSHMDYEQQRTSQPSLVEMTEKAVNYFQARQQQKEEGNDFSNGYILVIEGARIDHGHHKGNAHRALVETEILSQAVKLADDMTDDRDTLIVVTADHSHTLSMAGYPKRGNPILGLVKDQKNELVLAEDGMPYTTLGYTNGKGGGIDTRQLGRLALVEEHVEDPDFHQEALFERKSESHGSDDVALHAKGAGAEGFAGLMEQHEIYHVLRAALEPTSETLRGEK